MQTRGLNVCCIGLLALGISTFWFPSWAKNFARMCVWVFLIQHACVLFIYPTDGIFWSAPMMDCEVLCFFSFQRVTQVPRTKIQQMSWTRKCGEEDARLKVFIFFMQSICFRRLIVKCTFILFDKKKHPKNRWVIEVLGEVMRQSVVVKSVFKNTRVLLICNNVSIYLFLSE